MKFFSNFDFGKQTNDSNEIRIHNHLIRIIIIIIIITLFSVEFHMTITI